jgi:hypothetical protein
LEDSHPILARNILILYAILQDKDGRNDSLLWEIYYHIFLSAPALRLLQDLATKLLDLTKSVEKWNANTHSGLLRFVNQDTLSQFRTFLERYCKDTVPGKEDILASMEEFKKTRAAGFVTASARSAGPFFIKAFSAAPGLHNHYWGMGVIWGHESKSNHTNPTMILTNVRGANFVVHYGTEPTLPFHTAPALVPIAPSDPLYQSVSGQVDTADACGSRIAKTAKSQFSIWSASAQESSSPRPKILYSICNLQRPNSLSDTFEGSRSKGKHK